MAYVNFDDELKRRQAQARAKGMDEATIQKFSLIDKVMNQRQKQAVQPQAQQGSQIKGTVPYGTKVDTGIQKQPSTAKKLLVNTGALVASLGAGALSAAAAPVTGGLSLAGGFAAGAGIEALRRKMLGEKQNLGASALEGGLTILPGVGQLVGKTSKALKTAKVASDIGKEAKTASRIANIAPEKEGLKQLIKGIVTPSVQDGRVAKLGNTLKAEARGIKTGLKPQGAVEKLLPSEADAINRTLNELPRTGRFGRQVKGTVGSVPRQLRDVESAQSKATISINNALEKLNKPIKTTTTRKSKDIIYRNGDITGDNIFLTKNKKVADSYAFNPETGMNNGRKTIAYEVNPKAKIYEADTKSGLLKELGYNQRDKFNNVINKAPDNVMEQEKLINKLLKDKGYDGVKYKGYNADQAKLVGKADETGEFQIFNKNMIKQVSTQKNKTTSDVSDEIIKGMRNDRKNILSLNESHIKEANDLERRVKNAKDYKELETLRKSADERINFARNPNSPDPALEKVYLSARRNIDNVISKLSPELKAAKTNYRNIELAKDALVMNAPGTLKSGGGALTGKLMSSGAMQKGFDVAGNAITRTSKIASTPLAKAGMIQTAGRALVKPYTQEPQQEAQLSDNQLTQQMIESGQLPPEQAENVPQDAESQIVQQLAQSEIQDPQQMFEALSTMETPEQTQQSRSEQYMAMADEAIQAGDAKSAKTFMDFAKTASEMEALQAERAGKAGGDTALNVTKPTSEKYAQAVGGANALTQLRQLIQQTGGVPQGTRVPGQGINFLGIGSDIKRASGTGEYDTLGFAAVDNMLRIATGAAAPDSEIRRYMDKYLPKPGDDQATIQRKLDTMEAQFNSILALAQPGGTNSMDINTLFNQGVQ